VATVVFYEKPGCGTNARQKLMLANAGHALEVKSLLAEPWTVERLKSFFGDTPVASWFNPAAPAVKSGAVDPAAMEAEAALAARTAAAVRETILNMILFPFFPPLYRLGQGRVAQNRIQTAKLPRRKHG